MLNPTALLRNLADADRHPGDCARLYDVCESLADRLILLEREMGAMKDEMIRDADARSLDNAADVAELRAENARLRAVLSWHDLDDTLPTDADRAWAAENVTAIRLAEVA